MKKYNKIMLAIALLQCAASTNLYAQKNDIVFGLDTHISTYDKKFSPIELGAEVSYGFTNWLTAGIRLEEAFAHVKEYGEKTYLDNSTVGIVANGDVWKFGQGVLAVKASAGTTFTDNDWKYNYYDCGLFLSSAKCETRKTLGFGVRYYDNRTDGLKDKFRVYLSLGFSFSLK